MASPKALISLFVNGTRIVGKAFFEAGKQAARNARASPQAGVGGDAGGVGHASSGSITDQLTRQHRMTLDEAYLILNIKKGEETQKLVQNYEHLFKANSPAEAKPPVPGAKPTPPPAHSHYVQSKVQRAKERIDAEQSAVDAPSPSPPAAEATSPITPAPEPTAKPGNPPN